MSKFGDGVVRFEDDVLSLGISSEETPIPNPLSLTGRCGGDTPKSPVILRAPGL